MVGDIAFSRRRFHHLFTNNRLANPRLAFSFSFFSGTAKKGGRRTCKTYHWIHNLLGILFEVAPLALALQIPLVTSIEPCNIVGSERRYRLTTIRFKVEADALQLLLRF